MTGLPAADVYFDAPENPDDSVAPLTVASLRYPAIRIFGHERLLDKLATRSYSIGEPGCHIEICYKLSRGNNAGVVDSEKQSVQNTQDELMEPRARRLFYPERNAFRYKTGGTMEHLRVLPRERIFECRNEMYQPRISVYAFHVERDRSFCEIQQTINHAHGIARRCLRDVQSNINIAQDRSLPLRNITEKTPIRTSDNTYHTYDLEDLGRDLLRSATGAEYVSACTRLDISPLCGYIASSQRSAMFSEHCDFLKVYTKILSDLHKEEPRMENASRRERIKPAKSRDSKSYSRAKDLFGQVVEMMPNDYMKVMELALGRLRSLGSMSGLAIVLSCLPAVIGADLEVGLGLGTQDDPSGLFQRIVGITVGAVAAVCFRCFRRGSGGLARVPAASLQDWTIRVSAASMVALAGGYPKVYNDDKAPNWLFYVVYGGFIVLEGTFIACQWLQGRIGWNGFRLLLLVTLLTYLGIEAVSDNAEAYMPLAATLSSFCVVWYRDAFDPVKNQVRGISQSCVDWVHQATANPGQLFLP